MPIRDDKIKLLRERMEHLGIREADLEEKFVMASGRGGQKVNKTASCVYLKHRPTGIDVKCQRERSRESNRFLARRELCDRFEGDILGKKTGKSLLAAKVRRQKKRRRRRGLPPES